MPFRDSENMQTPYTPMQPPAPGARTIRFPKDRSYGEIVMRDWGTPVVGGFYGRWSDLGFERLAEARGPVAIPPAKEVRLALAEGVQGLGEGLSLLEPDDLQQVATDRYRNSVIWTDEDCRRLSRLQGLTWVSLIGTAISDEGLRWLGQMPELRHLDLHRIDAITDEGISHLASLEKIETFFCPSPLLTDASMEVFGGGGSLLQIRLQGDHITDGGMAHMAGCARLTNMFIPPGVTWRGAAHLHGLPLVTIVIWGNRNIDDQALEKLVPLWEQTPTLTGLDLGHTSITDAGLPLLRRLEQLTWIDVTADGTTEEGIRALKDALPKIG